MVLGQAFAEIGLQAASNARLWQETAADGLMLFDSDAVTPSPEALQRHWPVRILDAAAKMGHPGEANMVMLGAFSVLSKLVELEMLKQALPASNREVNERALEHGFELAGYAT